MINNNNLLEYLIKETEKGNIDWYTIDHDDYLVTCRNYARFVNDKQNYEYNKNIISLKALNNTLDTFLKNETNVYHANVNGMDMYLIEEINYDTSYPVRTYNLRLIRMDTECRRKSFNQLVYTDSDDKVLINQLASLITDQPISEEENAYEFIDNLLNENKNIDI